MEDVNSWLAANYREGPDDSASVEHAHGNELGRMVVLLFFESLRSVGKEFRPVISERVVLRYPADDLPVRSLHPYVRE